MLLVKTFLSNQIKIEKYDLKKFRKIVATIVIEQYCV